MLDRADALLPRYPDSEALLSKTLSSLAGAALQDGGWRIALRDLSTALGGAARLRLCLSDQASRYIEQFDWCRPPGGGAVQFFRKTLGKRGGWNAVHGHYPKTAVSLIENCADVRSSALLRPDEIFADFPATGALLALIDMGGVQGALAVDVSTHDADARTAALQMMQRLHLPLEQAAIAHSTVVTIQSQLVLSGALLDHLPFGLITLDTTARILSTNAAGQRLIGLGTVLAVRDQRLYASDSSENQIIQTALQNLLQGRDHDEPRLLKLYGLDGDRPWSLSISRPDTGDDTGALAWSSRRPAAVICVSDRDPITTVRARQVAATYGLSPQEELLAARIAAGDTLALIAERTRRSVETLRTQLRAVFQKTEVRSQAELVQLVLCAPTAPSRL